MLRTLYCLQDNDRQIFRAEFTSTAENSHDPLLGSGQVRSVN